MPAFVHMPPCIRLLLHPFLPQTIILQYDDWRPKTTWANMASSVSPSHASGTVWGTSHYQCYSSQQLREFRPEEICSESHVVNTHARPTSKTNTDLMPLAPKPHSAF